MGVDDISEFYTVQLSKIRHVKDLNFPVYNITAKNGIAAFAPSWRMVMGMKNGTMKEEEYKKEYYKLMRVSYRKNSAEWKEMMSNKIFLIACFCNEGEFCHKYLLAEILQECGCRYLGEFNP